MHFNLICISELWSPRLLKILTPEGLNWLLGNVDLKRKLFTQVELSITPQYLVVSHLLCWLKFFEVSLSLLKKSQPKKKKQSKITVFLWPISVKVQNLLNEKSYRALNEPRKESFQNTPNVSFSTFGYGIWDLFKIWTSSTPIFLVSWFKWKMYQG